MILVNELKACIVAKGLNQSKVAEILNITQKTFSLKIKKGKFNSIEIEKMIDILEIKDPIKIFFSKEN